MAEKEKRYAVTVRQQGIFRAAPSRVDDLEEAKQYATKLLEIEDVTEAHVVDTETRVTVHGVFKKKD